MKSDPTALMTTETSVKPQPSRHSSRKRLDDHGVPGPPRRHWPASRSGAVQSGSFPAGRPLARDETHSTPLLGGACGPLYRVVEMNALVPILRTVLSSAVLRSSVSPIQQLAFVLLLAAARGRRAAAEDGHTSGPIQELWLALDLALPLGGRRCERPAVAVPHLPIRRRDLVVRVPPHRSCAVVVEQRRPLDRQRPPAPGAGRRPNRQHRRRGAVARPLIPTPVTVILPSARQARTDRGSNAVPPLGPFPDHLPSW